MANIRPERASYSKQANDESTANKSAAEASNNVPDLKLVVMDIASTTQTLVAAVQRTEEALSDLTRRA